MRGFHVDMNVGQYRADYLEKWLRHFARNGYDAIVWEVENNVQWETCPECASPDAFTKDEFRDLLEMSRGLGLEPIPLFQTIAHCEYVLKHEPYQHLAEIPGKIEQYCPRNPDLLPFLNDWIAEYLELFGELRYFHLGADEAWWMGECEKCRAFVEERSMSELYIQHINALTEPLLERGISPIIWADMVLHHNEALDKLTRDIMLFDWIYSVHRGSGKVQVWGTGQRDRAGIPDAALETFGPYLFPEGDEPGRDPETFYTADFLADKGFQVVTCPSSSSAGDTVFTPRNWFHMANTFDSFKKGMEPHLSGSVLTSWSVRLHPWELQLACFDIPPFLAQHPEAALELFQEFFVRNRFGSDDPAFFRACGLLSSSVLLSTSRTIGGSKACASVPLDRARDVVAKVVADGRAERELENCRRRLEDYRQALEMLRGFRRGATQGHEYLDLWELAARNLINRARATAFLLECHAQLAAGEPAPAEMKATGAEILEQMRGLRRETEELYLKTQKPTRARETVEWIFDTVEHALAGLVEA